MRKLIIKYFARDYIFYVGKKLRSYKRASLPIVLSICLMAVMLKDVDSYHYWSMSQYMAVGVCFICIFFGFIYFKIWPYKFRELDEPQKWQFGKGAEKFRMKLTNRELIEWEVINAKRKKYKQYWPLIVNLLVPIAAGLYYIL